MKQHENQLPSLSQQVMGPHRPLLRYRQVRTSSTVVLFTFSAYPQGKSRRVPARLWPALQVCAAAAVVRGAPCSGFRDPCLKIGGGVKREERGERAEWCQVSAAVLQSGKHRFHYSVV